MRFRIEPHRDAAAAHRLESKAFLRGAGEVARRFRAEPEGNFRAVDARGRTVGVCSAIVHGPTDGPPALAWIGGLYVAPAVRGHGVGRALFEAALEHARARRAARIGLDAVPELVPTYEAYGFRTVTRCGRWRREAPPGPPAPAGYSLYPISSCEWKELAAYDEAAFGALRTRWLAELLSDLPERAFVAMRGDGSLAGFAAGQEEFVGPVVADDERAAELLTYACIQAGSPARIHALASPSPVDGWLRRRGWTSEEATCVRMTTDARANGDPSRQFGVGAWAVG